MKNIFQKFTNFSFSMRSFPIFLLFITLITYGILIAFMGIYWDDWPFAWLLHMDGPASFIENFSMFRPFLGPIFVLTTSVLGESPIAWQIFGIVIRYFCALSLWWTLTKIWPNNLRQNSWISIFFLVFPGFQAQWVSFTHTNQALIPMLFQIISLGLMAWWIRNQKYFSYLLLLSIIFGLIGLFPTEYFFGIELLRPILIWIILIEKHPSLKERLKQSIIYYIPFGLILILNIIWLITFHRSGNYVYVQADSIINKTGGILQAVISFFQDSINSIAVAGLESWFGSLNILQLSFNSLTTKLSLVLIVSMAFFISFYLNKINYKEESNVQTAKTIDNSAIQLIFVGLVGILVGRIPSWAAGFPLKIEFPWDRLLLPMMLGSSILFIGLIEFLGKGRNRKVIFFSIFVSLAIGQQFIISNTYKRDWDNVQKFLWQLQWRMPEIEPGTSLITHELPFSYVTDNSLSAAVNWLYEDTNSDLLEDNIMPYMLVYSKSRLNSPLFPSLESNLPIKLQYRTYTYLSNTSDSIVFYYPSEGCLRILDPIYANKNLYPEMTYMLTDTIGLSNPQLILNDKRAENPQNSESVFVKEPQRDWCYFYAKAELARQNDDWQGITEIFEQTINQGLSTNHPIELLPFVEAFGRIGNLEFAKNYTLEILSVNPELNVGLCEVWDRIEKNSNQLDQIKLMREQLKDLMRCDE